MKKRNLSIICNLIIVILEVIGLVITLTTNHKLSIEYYTEESNILALIVFSIFLYFVLRKKEIPKWLGLLKYITTICLAVTFFVVIFILAPMFNFNYYYFLFYRTMLIYHLLGPLLGIFTFILFDNINISKRVENFIGISYTFIYAIVLIILNIVHLVDGPYPFLMVYNQPIYMSVVWFGVILGLAYFLGFIIRKLANIFNK